MGNWNIAIAGVGPHQSMMSYDAEQIYKKFVEELKASGHYIVQSNFISGSAYYDTKQIPPIKDGV